MPATITDTKANPTLLAFTPRQVLLGSRQTMKHSSNNNGSSNATVGLKLEQKVLLHQSIAHYLECSGFSKTLKKFRSEAKIEKDNLDGTLVDLQEMWLKGLEVCKDAKANNNNQKEQGKHSEKDGDSNLMTNIANGSKKKKKKSDKSDSDAVVHQSGTDENSKGSKNSGEMTYGSDPEPKVISKEKDADKKCKEKKKKQSKLASESLSNHGEDNQFESPPTVTKVKLRDNATAVAKTVNGGTKKKSKDKKKKRDKPSHGVDAEELQNGDLDETVSKKDDFETANEQVTDKKKDSKKRKRLTSEEIDALPSDGKVDEEPKRRKIENLNESKGGEQSAKMNGYLKSDLNSSKENIGEKGQSNDKLQRTSGEQLDGKINGDLGNTGEQSSKQKSQKKQQKGSVEQKAVKAFQRVKTDEVEFADERLQDNSYWAKDGAQSGYGAKAEEILGQVRGRDFRHEKTKKKRGTYRGGQIDLQSHSIKFSYSDDD